MVSNTKTSMSTRNPKDIKGLNDTTEFVMHKSQQTLFSGLQDKIIDYTEHRLIRYFESIVDAQQKLVVAALIEDYRKGRVACAWRRGAPVYVRVSKE